MRRAMAARWRLTYVMFYLDAGRWVPAESYFDPVISHCGDTSRCEQTRDALSSNVVADGTRLAESIQASPLFL
jgi:hypothetical protein